MTQRETHPLAGKTVRLKVVEPNDNLEVHLNNQEFRVEDWVENVAGKSWMMMDGNPAALQYAIRSGLGNLPTDDEVVYGKVNGLRYIIHISELGEEIG